MPAADDRDRVNRSSSSGHDVFDLTWTDDSLRGLVRVDFDLAATTTTAAVVVVPAGEHPVALMSSDLPLPVGALELRGPGIWLELVCEVPLDHWTVGLEAFGVTVDDRVPISVETRGERVPIGLDLDLDTVDPGPTAVLGGFAVPLRVHGEVLWGSTGREIDAPGRRGRGGIDVAVGSEHQDLRDRIRT